MKLGFLCLISCLVGCKLEADTAVVGEVGLKVPLGKKGKPFGHLELPEKDKGGAGHGLRIELVSEIRPAPPLSTPALPAPSGDPTPTEPASARPTPRPRVRLDPAARRPTEEILVSNLSTNEPALDQLLQSVMGFVNERILSEHQKAGSATLDGKGAKVTFSLFLEDSRIEIDAATLTGHPDAQTLLSDTLRLLSKRLIIPAELRGRLADPVVFRLEKT